MPTGEQIYLAMYDGAQGVAPALFAEGAPNDLIDLHGAAAYFAGAGVKGNHARISEARDIGHLIDLGVDADLLRTYAERKGTLPAGVVVDAGGSAKIGTSPKLRLPLHPRQMPCVGMNRAELFQPGQKRSAGKMPQIREAPSFAPMWWLKAVTSVTGPNDPIIHPGDSHTTFLIPEPELALVIGKRLGPGIASPKARDALSYLAGYCIMDEVSALDIEFERGGDPFAFNLAWSKSYPTFAPIGPAILVAGDLDPNNLTVTMQIDGENKLKASTSDYLWSAAELIEHFAAVVILEPGDIIACGNLAGANTVRPGNRIDIEFEHLGLLSNPMVATKQVSDFAVPARASEYARRFGERSTLSSAED
jgi:2-keto-4-pentenoate hydratase/2-oxohepta-3-ene-1,7-dioic acid hydratase in catechol pathway